MVRVTGKDEEAVDSDDNRLEDDLDLAETKALEREEKRIADEVQRQVSFNRFF